MSFLHKILTALNPSSASAQELPATRATESVMGEFLEAFGPTHEVRTEEAAVLEGLMPDALPPRPAAEDDPLADWGKQS